MNSEVELTPIAAVFGLVALLFVPLLNVIVLWAVLLAAAAAVVVFAGAVVTAPFLLARSVIRHRRARIAGGYAGDPGDPSRLRREAAAGALASADRPKRGVRELPGTRVGVGAC